MGLSGRLNLKEKLSWEQFECLRKSNYFRWSVNCGSAMNVRFAVTKYRFKKSCKTVVVIAKCTKNTPDTQAKQENHNVAQTITLVQDPR